MSACGAATGTASPTSHTALTPPVSSSSAVTVSPMVRPTVALCWMPALLGVDQGGKRGLAGYIDVSSATTLLDPQGNIINIEDKPVPPGGAGTSPQWALEAQPTLRGEPFASYSVPLGRWLPARPEMVAPDGMHYAYKAPDGPLHLVDVAHLNDRTIANPTDLSPIGYTAAGVWLVAGAGSGLWLLDSTTASITKVLAPDPSQTWLWLRGDGIWGANSSGLPGSSPSTALLHFDIAARVATTWYSQSGSTVTLAAVDSTGVAAIVISHGTVTTLAAVTGPGQSAALTPPAGTTPQNLVSGARQETDTHGGWILASAGAYLFSAKTGIRRVGPGSTSDIVPAGECLSH